MSAAIDNSYSLDGESAEVLLLMVVLGEDAGCKQAALAELKRRQLTYGPTSLIDSGIPGFSMA